MDQREHMTLSGSSSYYIHRESKEQVAGFQDLTIMNPLSNANLRFSSNTGSSLIGSTLPLDTSSTISPHRVSVGPPSAVLQGESMRRKRGRPRKYGQDGAVPSALLPSTPHPATVSRTEKRRGRPPGTGRKLKLASLGMPMLNFGGTLTPHVIHVVKGEDIKRKILSFLHQKKDTIIYRWLCRGSSHCSKPSPGYRGKYSVSFFEDQNYGGRSKTVDGSSDQYSSDPNSHSGLYIISTLTSTCKTLFLEYGSSNLL